MTLSTFITLSYNVYNFDVGYPYNGNVAHVLAPLAVQCQCKRLNFDGTGQNVFSYVI